MSCLVVKRRHVRTDPFYDDETGIQVGWYTKPADWYIARSTRTRYGVTYTYEGLKDERGFKTKREARERRDFLNKQPFKFWNEKYKEEKSREGQVPLERTKQ